MTWSEDLRFAVQRLLGHYFCSMAAEHATDGCWSIREVAHGDTLLSNFVGTTPTDEFSAFLAALTARLPEAPATLIFDLRQLDGHNPEAKELIKDWLLRHKIAIREVVVVVPQSKILLKLVTAAIGIAVGVKITLREEWVATSNLAAS